MIKEFHPVLVSMGMFTLMRAQPELQLDGTRIVNAVPSRLIEI